MLSLQELRSLSDNELQMELKQARKELLKLKLGVKIGQEKATHKVLAAKKKIARLLTVIKEFQSGKKGKADSAEKSAPQVPKKIKAEKKSSVKKTAKVAKKIVSNTPSR